MYSYTEFDDAFIAERNAQFRAQVERRIDGSLTEDEFKPLRLMYCVTVSFSVLKPRQKV